MVTKLLNLHFSQSDLKIYLFKDKTLMKFMNQIQEIHQINYNQIQMIKIKNHKNENQKSNDPEIILYNIKILNFYLFMTLYIIFLILF
jgi:hypothetical protein